MIYDLDHGFCHVHIPRTAGVAILEALAAECPNAVVRRWKGRHRRGWQIRSEVGRERWAGLYRFTVFRAPHEVIESDWRLTLDAIGRLNEHSREHLVEQWFDRLVRVREHGRFDRFVREEWLGEFSGIHAGGLWRTFCEDRSGRDLGVEPILFERLGEAWGGVCDRIGIRRVELQRMNAATRLEVKWPKRLRLLVDSLFAADYERLSRLGKRGGRDEARKGQGGRSGEPGAAVAAGRDTER